MPPPSLPRFSRKAEKQRPGARLYLVYQSHFYSFLQNLEFRSWQVSSPGEVKHGDLFSTYKLYHAQVLKLIDWIPSTLDDIFRVCKIYIRDFFGDLASVHDVNNGFPIIWWKSVLRCESYTANAKAQKVQEHVASHLFKDTRSNVWSFIYRRIWVHPRSPEVTQRNYTIICANTHQVHWPMRAKLLAWDFIIQCTGESRGISISLFFPKHNCFFQWRIKDFSGGAMGLEPNQTLPWISRHLCINSWYSNIWDGAWAP